MQTVVPLFGQPVELPDAVARRILWRHRHV